MVSPGGMEQKCTTVTFRIFPEAEIGLCPKWQKQPHRLRHRFNDRSGILLLLLCRLWSVLSGFHPEMGEFWAFFGKIGCLAELESGETIYLHHKHARFFYTRTLLNKY